MEKLTAEDLRGLLIVLYFPVRQTTSLGLVVNALILWTTRYMDAALNHLRATGAEVKKEDLDSLFSVTSTSTCSVVTISQFQERS
jgi:Tn3 transposase DDE domain